MPFLVSTPCLGLGAHKYRNRSAIKRLDPLPHKLPRNPRGMVIDNKSSLGCCRHGVDEELHALRAHVIPTGSPGDSHARERTTSNHLLHASKSTMVYQNEKPAEYGVSPLSMEWRCMSTTERVVVVFFASFMEIGG